MVPSSLMDAYRAAHGPSLECKTWPMLCEILQAAQPPIDLLKSSAHLLHEREPIKFFPQTAIKDILSRRDGHNPVKEILRCRCETCANCAKNCERLPPNELKRVAKKIADSCKIILAILIYIGHGHLIRYFGPKDRIEDSSLDSVTTVLGHEENLDMLKNLLGSHDTDAFCKLYDSARDIFDPPTFALGGPTTPYSRIYRMPFLQDEPHARGSSGKIHKFDIHEDYLDQKIKDLDWYRESCRRDKKVPSILLLRSTLHEADTNS